MGKPQNKRKKQSESDVSESLSDSEDSGAEEVIPAKKVRAAAKPAVKKTECGEGSSGEESSPKKSDKAAAKKPAKADDSDSDSGPDDKNPTPKKGGKSTKTVEKNGEVFWDLDKNKRVSVSDFKGKTYIQIREYYEKDGKQLPGKKGIGLPLNLWEKLKELTPEIDEVLKEKK